MLYDVRSMAYAARLDPECAGGAPCPICHEPLTLDPRKVEMTPCGHHFHHACMRDFQQTGGEDADVEHTSRHCPVCRLYIGGRGESPAATALRTSRGRPPDERRALALEWLWVRAGSVYQQRATAEGWDTSAAAEGAFLQPLFECMLERYEPLLFAQIDALLAHQDAVHTTYTDEARRALRGSWKAATALSDRVRDASNSALLLELTLLLWIFANTAEGGSAGALAVSTDEKGKLAGCNGWRPYVMREGAARHQQAVLHMVEAVEGVCRPSADALAADLARHLKS